MTSDKMFQLYGPWREREKGVMGWKQVDLGDTPPAWLTDSWVMVTPRQGELKLNIPLTTHRKSHINSKIGMSLNDHLSLHLSKDAQLVLLDGHAWGSGAMEVNVQPLSISAVPHTGFLWLHGARHPAPVHVLSQTDVGNTRRVLADQVHVGVQ